jgi:hypothetical protein
VYRSQKGTVMHIASGRLLTRRDPVQSGPSGAPDRRTLDFVRPAAEDTDPAAVWLRKILPAVILLFVLAAFGSLFPILF